MMMNIILSMMIIKIIMHKDIFALQKQTEKHCPECGQVIKDK